MRKTLTSNYVYFPKKCKTPSMLRWLTELNEAMVLSVHAPAKGLTAILIHVQSKSDSTMVKICPFTVSPLNPPSSRQQKLSLRLDSKLDLQSWPKGLRMTKHFRNCCLRILWKANSHFAMKMNLIPFFFPLNIFTEFQTCYKITIKSSNGIC